MSKPATTTVTVLIVDDTPQNISLLNVALSDEYSIKVATSGKQAIDLCLSMHVDIILLDVMMPEMDGFETCRRLKQNPITSAIPVIFVTGRGEVKDEEHGFACGAVDYITKPIRAPIVRSRIKMQLAFHNQNKNLEQLVLKRTAELSESRLEILHSLGIAGEYRDNETGLHVARVCNYSKLIAMAYGLPEVEAELLYNVAALHDVGKIGIPDSILFKPGKLDVAEWNVMRTHCEIGRKIIGNHKTHLLKTASIVAFTHHERWDGSGYPCRVKGNDIPLFGRITAIADVFDALSSERPYKRAWSVEETVGEISNCSGLHFDPQVVDAFLQIIPEMAAVKEGLADAK